MSEAIVIPAPTGRNWEKTCAASLVVQDYIRSIVGEGFEEDQLFFLLRELPGWYHVKWERGQALFRLLEEQGVLTSWMQTNPRRRYYAAAHPGEAEKYQAKVMTTLTERLLKVVGSHDPTLIRRALLAVAEEKGIVL